MNDESCTFALNDYARDFFLYAYFGIVTKKLKAGDQLIEADTRESASLKCAYRAYLDMCRTLDYKKENDPKRSCCIKCICSKIANILCSGDSLSQKRDEACKLLTDDEQVQECLIDKLEQPATAETSHYVNDNGKRSYRKFYFGQAQKWINMTVKYMWLLGILDFADDDEFDVPLDGFIMKAAYEKHGIVFPRDEKAYNEEYYKQSVHVPDLSESWKGYSQSLSMPWSKLEKDEYDKIQQCIKCQTKKKNEDLMLWECEAWIEQALSEKAKEEKKKIKNKES